MARRASRRRIAAYVGVGLGLALLLLVTGVLIITQTDWGREQARRTLIGQLENAVHGRLDIGRVEGNLLRRIRLIDVVIEDEQGRPFLRADTIETAFSLPALARQQIALTDMRLVRPVLVLDQPPGEAWNYVRIFDLDPDAVAEPTAPGWGDWVSLHRIVVVDGSVTVRTEWKPPEGLTPAEEARALERALAGDTRENVVPVAGGHQNVMEFRSLNAALPRVLVAHPDTAGMPIDVARFSGIVQPFRPPAADVRDMTGNFRLVNDSLVFRNVTARLPGSELAAEGVYALHSGELLLTLDGAPLAFADLQWLYPPLPDEGGGSMLLRVEARALATRVVAERMDLRLGGGTITGRADVTTGDTLRLGPTDLQFANVDTRVFERFTEDALLPRHGRITGQFAATGTMAALDVDGDVTFVDHEGTGTSRVLAAGQVGFDEQTRFRNLRLEFRPLQAELVRAFAPDLPLRGTIAGTALLNGQTGAGAAAVRLDSDLTLRDPRTGVSRVAATGGIQMGDELLLRDLRLRFQPVQAALLREFAPDLPLAGTLTGQALLNGRPAGLLQVDGDVTLNDPDTGASRVLATGGIDMRGEPRLNAMRLRFDPFRLDLLRPYMPDLPPGATLAGAVTVDGYPARAVRLDGEVAITEPRSGVSRVAVSGGVRFGDAFVFDDLALRFDPLRVPLLYSFAPDLPVGGVLTGSATLNGDPAQRLAVRADLVHLEAGQRSHITGGGTVATAGDGWADVNVTLRPLALATAGRFAPAAGLQGTVAGDVRARGTLAALRIDADLRVADGGTIAATGTLDLVGDPMAYDLRLAMQQFDLAALSLRAPATTDLTGTVVAEGRGFDPATMRATLAADLAGSAIDGVAADLVRLRADIAAGLATVDSSIVRIGTAEAVIDGSFGLIATRSGTLTYRVAIDSLHAFAPWIPGAETGVTAAEPVIAAADLQDPVAPPAAGVPADTLTGPPLLGTPVARAGTVARDTARIGPPLLGTPVNDVAASDTAALRIAALDTVAPAVADTVTVLPADSLSGSLLATGTLRGNVERFAAEGVAEIEELYFRGNYVGQGRVAYSAAGVGDPTADVQLDAAFRELHVAGMAYDSASIEGEYRGSRFGEGRVSLAAWQDAATDLMADVEFLLSLDRNELRLADATLRLDTVTWRTARPGVVSWGPGGVEVDGIELVGSAGGRIFADGMLPVDGEADLEVVLNNVALGPFTALLQLEMDVEGRLDLDARLEGEAAAPRMAGAATLTAGRLNGQDVPDTRATFTYAARELTAEATLSHEGTRLAVADATLPVDLAFTGVTGSRLLPGPIRVDIVADSLPADALPALFDQVEDVQGRIRGNVAVRGTFETPVIQGLVDLDLGRMRIVPLGIRLDEIGGTLRLEDRLVVLDSLVARSDGPLRIAGTVDAADLTSPVFDLEVTALNSRVIDTSDARLNLDADLTVSGPLDALLIEGDIRTRRGVIYIPRMDELGSPSLVNLDDPGIEQRLDAELIAERERLIARSTVFDNVQTDINVIIDRDVWLRSTEANVEIYTPPDAGALRIRMNGQQGPLALEGTIITDRGEYEFMSRRFRLSRGSATFTGGPELDPIIQIAAEHEVRLPSREAFEIRVVLDGTMRDLTIALESSAQPPISQSDLLAYVAFGRDASSLLVAQGSALSGQGSGSGELVGNVAGMATQQLAAVALEQVVTEIEAGAMRSLGVDVFRVTPADLPPELFTGRWVDMLYGTEVEVGRYVSPRLFVAGQGRLGLVRPGMRAEYWTPDGFQWRTAWQPRFITQEPTLSERDPRSTSVFGVFLFREWRF